MKEKHKGKVERQKEKGEIKERKKDRKKEDCRPLFFSDRLPSKVTLP